MRCAELAKSVGVSPDTIRHYERMGLLRTAPRTSGGYRNYPLETLKRVQLIRRAINAGFSLRELAEILRVRDAGGVPCRSVLAAAAEKLKQVELQITQLKTFQHQLNTILKDWRKRVAKTRRGKPAHLLENLPEALEELSYANANRKRHCNVRSNVGGRVGPRSAGD